MASHALTVALGLSACLSLGCGGAIAAKRKGHEAASAPTYTTEQLLDLDRQADAAYRGGRLADAERLYAALARAVPEEAPYWYRLGNVFARANRSEEAVLAYRQTLLRDAGHARALHNLAVVRLRQAQAAFEESARVAVPGDAVHEESRRMTAMLQAAMAGGSAAASPAAGETASAPTSAAPAPAAPPAALASTSPATPAAPITPPATQVAAPAGGD